MRISIITVCYNAERHIEDCIRSVINQDYQDLEYIIIDGNSTDKTLELIKPYENRISKLVSEKDQGIYEAMNKGIALSEGDYIGFLNADDYYPNGQTLSRVAEKLQHEQTDCLFGDLVYVERENKEKIVRYFPAKDFNPDQMRKGLMPPHPTFIAKRSLFQEFGNFDTSFEICADFELIQRFLQVNRSSYTYLPEVMVHMRSGGISTKGVKSTLTINYEMLKACKKNGIRSNYFLIYSKYIKKIFQLLKRPQLHSE